VRLCGSELTPLPHREGQLLLSHRPQQRARAHAARQLAALHFPSDSTQLARRLRAFLPLEDKRLKIAARLGAGGHWLAAARTFALDVLTIHAYRIAADDLDNEQAHDCLEQKSSRNPFEGDQSTSQMNECCKG